MSGTFHHSCRAIAFVQMLFCIGFVTAWSLLPTQQRRQLVAQIQSRRALTDVSFENRIPAVVSPLYDDESVVTDVDLQMVLQKIVPRFRRPHLRPNYVEHALRVWGAAIEFDDTTLISGPQMVDYLLNSGKYVASWGGDSSPILQPRDGGVEVRWGSDVSASVHHDHMLASLAEAGVTLDSLVFTTSRQTTMEQILSESLRDFRLDERETEWSTMAFAFYLAPQGTLSWHNSQGRRITFDMLARRLMRCHRNQGVCLGTHRVYALMTLLRLNEDYGHQMLQEQTLDDVMQYLLQTRELIMASQSPDGSWPPNWFDGEAAALHDDPEEKIHRRVIATGHHLEWLAIAPAEFHPPHEQIVKAADWLVQNTRETPQDVINANYTFYSHVGNALALWRRTTVSEFWQRQQANHLP